MADPRNRRQAKFKKFFVEGLERRTLFDLTVGVTFAVTGEDYSAVPIPAPSGFLAKLGANLDGEAPGNPELTGTVTFGWYGGTVLGTVTVVPTGPDPSFDTATATLDATLDASSAGTPLASGTYAGYHVLYATYSGDGVWPATTFTDADFQALEQSGAAGGGDSSIISFGSSDRLSVTAQPGNTAANDIIAPVKVARLTTSGSVDASASTTVMASITPTSTGTGFLSGVTSVTTVDGVATFNGLSIDKPGQYGLTFTDSSGNFATSGLFNVTGGKLVFLKAPKDGNVGAALNPSVVVALEDSLNHIIVADNSSVVTLTPIGIAANPTFSGNTATLVNGVATFSNLILNKPDFYKLQADDGGDTEVTSDRFKIAGDHLVFKTQPTTGNAGTPLPLTVQLLDSKNKVVTDATSTVVLNLNTVSSGTNAVLSGTTSLAFVNGVALFSSGAGPMITVSGKYTLTATEEEYNTGVLIPTNTTTAITTKQFTIKGLHLSFVRKPVDTDAGSVILFEIKLLDSNNKPVTTGSSANDGLYIIPTPTVSDHTDFVLLNGDYVSATTAGLIFSKPGTYTLTATASNGVDEFGQIQDDPEVTAAAAVTFKVLGLHLSFFKKPVDTSAGTAIPFEIKLLDVHNKKVTTGSSANDLLEIISTPTVSSNTEFGLVNGDYASTAPLGLTFSKPGSYTLTATASNGVDEFGQSQDDPVVASAPAVAFKVLGLHLSFFKKPVDTSSGSVVPLEIKLLNSHNKPATTGSSANDLLEIISTPAISSNTEFSLLNGDYVSDTSGGLIITKPGTYTLTATASNGLDENGQIQDDPVVASSAPVTFKVLGLHLSFVKKPVDTSIGDAIPFEIKLLDSHNKPVTTGKSASDLLDIIPTPTVSDNTEFSLQDGDYVSAKPAGFTISEPGTYTLTATASDGLDENGQVADDPVVAAATPVTFKVLGLHLVVTDQPSDISVNDAISIRAAIENFRNEVVTTATTDALHLSYAKTGPDATIVGFTVGAFFVNGVASLNSDAGDVISQVGTYELFASRVNDTGVVESTDGAISDAFKVTGLHLVFSQQPANSSVNAPILTSVEVEDANNDIVTTEDGNSIHLSYTATVHGSPITPSLDQAIIKNGIGVFDAAGGPVITQPGTYDLIVSESDTTGTLVTTTDGAVSDSFKVS